MGIDVDPLTCEWWHDLQPWRWGCDCPAKDNDAMAHSETCWVTPIYASIVPAIFIARNQLALASLAIPQTVIKCANCRRDTIASTCTVIRMAPLQATNIQLNSPLPGNIVKAICEQCDKRINRKGTMGFSQPAVSGL